MSSVKIKVMAGRFWKEMTLIDNGDNIIVKFPFSWELIDEIKNMEGARAVFDDTTKKFKYWTIKKSTRNAFVFSYLQGLNPYERYEKDLVEYKSNRKLYEHQLYNVRAILTRKHMFLADEMGLGKSLVFIEVMEASGFKGDQWIWVAPRSGIRAAELQLLEWKSKVWPQLVTYNGLKKLIEHWPKDKPAPRGIIFDEVHEIKNPMAQRSQAAQYIANNMRKEYDEDCFIIEATGTPAPKSPADWWFPLEIACPGYIKESNIHKFKQRLGIIVQKESPAGGVYPELVSWYDNELKCKKCGKFEDHLDHSLLYMTEPQYHPFEKSINEVQNFYERAKGLVVIHFKKDVLKELPDKHYRIIRCEPSKETLRAAKLILKVAPRAITAAILLRELSDGFQYQDIKTGSKVCKECFGDKFIKHPVFKFAKCISCGNASDEEILICPNCNDNNIENVHVVEEIECLHCNGTGKEDIISTNTVEVDCPKVAIFEDILEEHIEVGRLVTYCGFTGSVNRCVGVALKNEWDVMRVDGRGWTYFRHDGLQTNYKDIKMLQYFQDKSREVEKLVFIGQADSAGMGLTLTESPTIFYYSNTFNAKSRMQSEDRIHRPGMDINKGATIIDCFHLQSDELIYNNLKKKRDLQNLSMGELNECIK